MTTRQKQNELTSIFKLFPDNLLDKETFRKLNALSNELDTIFFLDDSGELAADRDAVIRIAKGNMLLAPDLHEIALLETAKHLGRHLKKKKGTDHSLTWREAATHGVPIAPLSDAEQRALGIKKTHTEEELRSLLAQQFPEINKVWLGPATPSVKEDVFRNLARNRTFWDCVVAQHGIWAAAAIVAAIGSIVIFFFAGGLLLPLLVTFLFKVLGVGLALSVLACILFPG